MPEAALVETIEASGLRVVEVLQRGRNARTGAKESQVSVILAARPPSEPRRFALSSSPIVDERRVRGSVQREFARIALFPRRSHSWRVGRDHAVALGYPDSLLQALPAPLVDSFSGVADPCGALSLRPGEAVVDVGSGSGVDALLAARKVGADGQVIGVELTEELLRQATALGTRRKPTNVRFEKGIAEKLPLADGIADAVLANGVINLFVVDKEAAIHEAWRVLKPGGRLVLADVVVRPVASLEVRAVPERWATDLAGPIPEDELLEMLREIGFAGVSVAARSDPFAGAKLEESARAVGATGLVVVAVKNVPGNARGKL